MSSTRLRRRAPKRFRSGSASDNERLPLPCVGCSQDVSGQLFIVLEHGRDGTSIVASFECDHRLCMSCFGQAQADRGTDILVRCRSRNCTYESRKWRMHPVDGRGSRGATVSQEIPRPLGEDNKAMHPALYFQYQDEVYQKSFSILSLVTQNPDNPAAPNLYVADFRNSGDNTDIQSSELESLQAIGQSLHACLMPPRSHPLYASSKNAYANQNCISELEREDQTPLRTLLHGISTGKKSYLGDEDVAVAGRERMEQQRELNASFAAADILRTAKGGCRLRSKFKDLISNSLNIANVGDYVKGLLRYCGLSRSKTFLSLAEEKAVTEKKSVRGRIPKAADMAWLLAPMTTLGLIPNGR